LSDKQTAFASDIVSSYQLLRQINEWQKQFKPEGLDRALQ